MRPLTSEAAPSGDLTQNHEPLVDSQWLAQAQTVSSLGRFDLDATSRRERLLDLVRAHPNWTTISDLRRARIEVLILGETDAEADVLTRRSVRELCQRYDWKRGQVQHDLEALRATGIAMSRAEYDFSGSGASQIGSRYTLRRDGVLCPQTKRKLTPARQLAAQKRAATRRAKKAARERRQIARLLSVQSTE